MAGKGSSTRRRQSSQSASATSAGNAQKSRSGSGGGGAGGADSCDIFIDVDLEGVRTAALSKVQVGDILKVELDERGGTPSVVCQRSDGTAVGSLAAFGRISNLINCLRDGVIYQLSVTAVEAGRCHVRGNRVAK